MFTDTMLYLNTQHSLPIHGSRSVPATLNTPIEQPRARGQHEDALADVHATPVKVEIDQYPSRYAYGFRKVGDLTKEYRDKAFSNIVQTTKKHAGLAVQAVKSAGHNTAAGIACAAYRQQLSEYINSKRIITIGSIPDPTITVIPSEVKGDIRTRTDKYMVDTKAYADISFNRGSYEGYLKDQGFIRRWTSVGDYDIRI